MRRLGRAWPWWRAAPAGATADGAPGGPAALVLQFHKAFGLPVADAPLRDVPERLAASRLALLQEEADEYASASGVGDVEAMTDALADIVYVCYGTAAAYGVDLDAVVREVHASNMRKLWPHRGPVLDEAGKVLKPPGWRSPNVAAAAGLVPRAGWKGR